MKKTTLSAKLVAVIFCIIFLFGCHDKKSPAEKEEVVIENDADPGNRTTDIIGAAQYEFNMEKNPVTGKIPEGIRDAELAQAAAMNASHPSFSRIDANTYTFQGPNNLGGRTRAIVYDKRFNGSSNQVIIAGGISGGIYKSVDDGATWTRKSPTSDLFNVSTVAQDPRAGFEDTWYYAGGEFIGNSASGTGASYRGKGVYKSVDNGETWTFLPSSNTGAYESFDNRADYIAKIVVDPTNGNVYFAGVDAIYRSTDGGSTWSIVLTSGSGGISSSYITDIVVTTGGKFYAAFSGTSPTSPTNITGVWSSTTGASGSWTKIAGTGSATTPAGWNAAGAYGRVVLAIAPSLETRVYALYWNGVTSNCAPASLEAEMYYWDDGLSTWTDISSTLPDEPGCLAGNDPFAVQTGYDLVIGVKPDDPATVFIGGTNIYRSTNTGASWTRIGGYASSATYAVYTNSHSDIHAIAFQPTSSTTMLCGNDGGIQRTTNNLAATVAWSQTANGYNTYQYYYVSIDPRFGNDKVIGGAQDNGSTRNVGGTGTTFEQVLSGDGVSVGLSDPAVSGGTQYEYVGSQLGSIVRRTSGSAPGTGTTITPTGESNSGLFVTLFKVDPDNSQTVYYANDNILYRTTSGSTVTSASWTSMSGIATAVGAANDITAIALTRGTYSAATSSIFFGTSNGLVFRLDDPAGVAAATAPVNITGGAFPAGGYVSSIAVNPRNDDTLLVTFSNYGVTSVFWTGNANTASPTWTAVEGALTLPSYRSAIIHAVPNSPQVYYYVGTSVGLYSAIGLPGTVSWTQEAASSLGNAIVQDMSFRPSDGNLLIGTHGYGMWKTVLTLIPLPVELTDFKGTLQTDKSALLEWNTATEYNSSHFELEKSLDGRNFRKIATVPAAGTSFTNRHYSYVDREPLTEVNYYRLRSVDQDNSFKLSSVVVVKLSGVQQDMKVLGNPFRQNLTIRFVKAPETQGEVRLTDGAGKLVVKKAIQKGEQVVFIELPGAVSKGTYFLEANIDKKTFRAKVLKL